ncbi:PTS system mannitol-specific IIB component [Nocardiopsis mwathae]|uniref:PTS system mannitol-specific IIB component n=1 Tax=Nocardiopsis mwathae TaxID=1472723 RepID=A0A7W9YHQ3_9ACTN|nr:PTS system mannitol-specific IIB component [Nocardiopsis mwathae]
MNTVNGSDVRRLVIACDAGMGSSALLKSQLAQTLAPYGVQVEHAPVDRVPAGADLVLCHELLAARARAGAPEAVVKTFSQFLGDPVFTEIVEAVKSGGRIAG